MRITIVHLDVDPRELTASELTALLTCLVKKAPPEDERGGAEPFGADGHGGGGGP